MNCRQVMALVTEYLEGALSPEDRRRFEAHIEGCPHCTEYLAEMRTSLRLLGSLKPERLPEPVQHELVRVFQDWKST